MPGDDRLNLNTDGGPGRSVSSTLVGRTHSDWMGFDAIAISIDDCHLVQERCSEVGGEGRRVITVKTKTHDNLVVGSLEQIPSSSRGSQQ